MCHSSRKKLRVLSGAQLPGTKILQICNVKMVLSVVLFLVSTKTFANHDVQQYKPALNGL